VGNWSQEPEYGTVINTVLKAGSTFSVGTTLPQQFMVFLGGTGSDNYGSGIENMSIDGSGIADGVYIGHVNEHTHMNYVDILNYPHVGMFECGADQGGPCTFGSKTGEGGAQGDGPYTNLQFHSDDALGATASTVAIWLQNTAMWGLDTVTITPSTANPANIPTRSIAFWGNQGRFSRIHGENAHALFTISPASGICTSGCNGSIGDIFDTINLTNTTGTSYIVDIQGATAESLLFQNLSDIGNTTCHIHYALGNGYSGCVATNVSWWMVDANGVPQSVETGFTTPTTSQYVFNGANYFQGSFFWKSSAGPTFGTTSVTQSDNGNIAFGGSGTSTDVLWNRGFNTTACYSGSSYSGLNLNPLEDSGSTGERGSLCSDIYWLHGVQLWAVANNGGGDYACLAFGNGFTGLAVSSGHSPGDTVTQASMNGNYAWATAASGHTFFGKGIISAGGALVPTDNGALVQVQGLTTASIFGSGVSSNTDQVGEVTLASATTSTVSWTGTYATHPECTATPQFDIGSGVRQFITYTGVASFTLNYTSAVSGTVSYACHYRN
jgi:hypothetical protein